MYKYTHKVLILKHSGECVVPSYVRGQVPDLCKLLTQKPVLCGYG